MVQGSIKGEAERGLMDCNRRGLCMLWPKCSCSFQTFVIKRQTWEVGNLLADGVLSRATIGTP